MFDTLFGPAAGGNSDAFTGGMLGFLGAERLNYTNAKQAQHQMSFQEHMSGTAHQREVADLRAAGLNPILSARHGGASTPSGAMAQMQDSIGAGVSSAMDVRRQNAEIRNTRQMNENLREQRLLTTADIHLRNAERNRANSAHLLYEQQRQTEAATTALTQNQVPGSNIERAIDESMYGEIVRRANRAIPAVSSAVGVGRLRGLTERALPPINRSREPGWRGRPYRPPHPSGNRGYFGDN